MLLNLVSAITILFLILNKPCSPQSRAGTKEAYPKKPLVQALPNEAKESGLSGLVFVELKLDEHGKVIEVGRILGPDWICPDVARPDVLALREAARKIASSSDYFPKMVGGKAVSSSLLIDVRFQGDLNRKPESRSKIEQYSVVKEPGNASKSLTISHPLPGSGLLDHKAKHLPKHVYPDAARAVRASGTVEMEILIEEDGSVFSARPKSGHPLLRPAARNAACVTKFSPTLLSGRPVKILGIVNYNFVP